jgi:hypothetical protein
MSEEEKVGFYPCCGKDILAPLEIMKGMVDRVIFCDKVKDSLPDQKAILDQVNIKKLPHPEFVIDDLRSVIPKLPEIHVFFYRGDSREGGSGLYIMGKKWLSKIIERFPVKNGLIITDGSNRDSRFFKKITRPEGYYWSAVGWKFKVRKPTPPPNSKKLYFIDVDRLPSVKKIPSFL